MAVTSADVAPLNPTTEPVNVLPGQIICKYDPKRHKLKVGVHISEIKQADGTVEKQVISSLLGQLRVTAQLATKHTTYEIEVFNKRHLEQRQRLALRPVRGDTVVAEVLWVNVRECTCDILAADGKLFSVRHRAVLKNSEIVGIRDVDKNIQHTLPNCAAYFAPNDIILAKVLTNDDPYELSTKDDRIFGVLCAFSKTNLRQMIPIGDTEMAEMVDFDLDDTGLIRREHRLISNLVVKMEKLDSKDATGAINAGEQEISTTQQKLSNSAEKKTKR